MNLAIQPSLSGEGAKGLIPDMPDLTALLSSWAATEIDQFQDYGQEVLRSGWKTLISAPHWLFDHRVALTDMVWGCGEALAAPTLAAALLEAAALPMAGTLLVGASLLAGLALSLVRGTTIALWEKSTADEQIRVGRKIGLSMFESTVNTWFSLLGSSFSAQLAKSGLKFLPTISDMLVSEGLTGGIVGLTHYLTSDDMAHHGWDGATVNAGMGVLTGLGMGTALRLASGGFFAAGRRMFGDIILEGTPPPVPKRFASGEDLDIVLHRLDQHPEQPVPMYVNPATSVSDLLATYPQLIREQEGLRQSLTDYLDAITRSPELGHVYGNALGDDLDTLTRHCAAWSWVDTNGGKPDGSLSGTTPPLLMADLYGLVLPMREAIHTNAAGVTLKVGSVVLKGASRNNKWLGHNAQDTLLDAYFRTYAKEVTELGMGHGLVSTVVAQGRTKPTFLLDASRLEKIKERIREGGKTADEAAVNDFIAAHFSGDTFTDKVKAELRLMAVEQPDRLRIAKNGGLEIKADKDAKLQGAWTPLETKTATGTNTYLMETHLGVADLGDAVAVLRAQVDPGRLDDRKNPWRVIRAVGGVSRAEDVYRLSYTHMLAALDRAHVAEELGLPFLARLDDGVKSKCFGDGIFPLGRHLSHSDLVKTLHRLLHPKSPEDPVDAVHLQNLVEQFLKQHRLVENPGSYMARLKKWVATPTVDTKGAFYDTHLRPFIRFLDEGYKNLNILSDPSVPSCNLSLFYWFAIKADAISVGPHRISYYMDPDGLVNWVRKVKVACDDGRTEDVRSLMALWNKQKVGPFGKTYQEILNDLADHREGSTSLQLMTRSMADVRNPYNVHIPEFWADQVVKAAKRVQDKIDKNTFSHRDIEEVSWVAGDEIASVVMTKGNNGKAKCIFMVADLDHGKTYYRAVAPLDAVHDGMLRPQQSVHQLVEKAKAHAEVDIRDAESLDLALGAFFAENFTPYILYKQKIDGRRVHDFDEETGKVRYTQLGRTSAIDEFDASRLWWTGAKKAFLQRQKDRLLGAIDDLKDQELPPHLTRQEGEVIKGLSVRVDIVAPRPLSDMQRMGRQKTPDRWHAVDNPLHPPLRAPEEI